MHYFYGTFWIKRVLAQWLGLDISCDFWNRKFVPPESNAENIYGTASLINVNKYMEMSGEISINFITSH